jgi:hypothetical protein
VSDTESAPSSFQRKDDASERTCAHQIVFVRFDV